MLVQLQFEEQFFDGCFFLNILETGNNQLNYSVISETY